MFSKMAALAVTLLALVCYIAKYARSPSYGSRQHIVRQPCRVAWFQRCFPALFITAPMLSVTAILLPGSIFSPLLVAESQVYAGAVWVFLSTVMFAVAVLQLGDNYSPCDSPVLPQYVRRTGLYAWVRHPVYSSTLSLFLGLIVMTGSPWLLPHLAILMICYRTSIEDEESVLVAHFPEYAEYQMSVGCLIPRCWPKAAGAPAERDEDRVGAMPNDGRSC